MIDLRKMIIFLFVLALFIYMLWTNLYIYKFEKFLSFLISIGLGLITLATFFDMIASLLYINLHTFIQISFTLGGIISTVAIILWSNYMKEKIDILNKFAHIDMMTGLYNRKGFEEIFKRNANQKIPFYIMFLDLDKTKVINDNFGHLSGDEYIRNSAQIISDEIGIRGSVGRIGGDEFIALLETIDEEEIENVKFCIKKRVSQIFHEGTTSISVGYSMYGKDGYNLEKLLSVADERMYEDKKK